MFTRTALILGSALLTATIAMGASQRNAEHGNNHKGGFTVYSAQPGGSRMQNSSDITVDGLRGRDNVNVTVSEPTTPGNFLTIPKPHGTGIPNDNDITVDAVGRRGNNGFGPNKGFTVYSAQPGGGRMQNSSDITVDGLRGRDNVNVTVSDPTPGTFLTIPRPHGAGIPNSNDITVDAVGRRGNNGFGPNKGFTVYSAQPGGSRMQNSNDITADALVTGGAAQFRNSMNLENQARTPAYTNDSFLAQPSAPTRTPSRSRAWMSVSGDESGRAVMTAGYAITIK